MTSRLMLSISLVALSITLVWALRPEQNAFEPLNCAELRRPLSALSGSHFEQGLKGKHSIAALGNGVPT